ncbi:MAG: hypothetical protein K9G62_02555 [Alphaproteobacteria bacterium]|nr:hypothetical protein [Alphaproteobacteria bacterium]
MAVFAKDLGERLMIRSIKLCALYFSIFCLSACAAVSVQSQLAPNIELTKNDALYLETPANAPIGHQKYMEALQDALSEQGFNLVKSRTSAKYVMSVDFNDFSAPLVQTVPDTQTTVYHGNVGSVPVSGSSTTIGNKQIHRQIPTHNSRILVRDRKSGNPVWEVSMAKSFDVYNHAELKIMIEKMISLYGKNGKATQIVGDQVRW